MSGGLDARSIAADSAAKRKSKLNEAPDSCADSCEVDSEFQGKPALPEPNNPTTPPVPAWGTR